jgi:hypothetical protein
MGAVAAVIAGGWVVGQPLIAHAASYSVVSNLDAAPGTCATLFVGTLRDCINAANAAGGTNTITFAATVVAPIVLSAGELDISGTQTLTITGSGQSATIIDGNAASRVFNNTSATANVTMTDLTVRNGTFTNPSGFDGGGGIKSLGPLTLTRVTVSGNQALAAIGVSATSGGVFFTGSGALTITNSTFSNNTVSSSTDAAGGAMQDCCTGTAHVTITNSTFSGNTSTTTTGQAYGGAIDSHSGATITGSTFTANTASQTSPTAGVGVGGAAINTHGSLTIDTSAFHANTTSGAAAGGGGVGAIEVCCGSNPLTLTLTNSTFDHNTSTGDGADAAALYLCCGASGSVSTSTFVGNSVTGTGSQAGAFEMDSTPNTPGFTITNSTFTGNSASGTGSRGGGLLVSITHSGVPAVNLVNDTIDANTASTGTNLFVARDGIVTALNTIIAGTPASNCVVQAGGTLTDNGHNLDDGSTSTCGFSAAKSDVLGQDPKLGALAANGGPTQTQALLTGSPAIDAATNTGCPTTDQRGITRITSTDPTCDIGAYELVQAAPVIPPGPLPPTGVGMNIPLAALLILGGGAILAAVRRRRNRGAGDR